MNQTVRFGCVEILFCTLGNIGLNFPLLVARRNSLHYTIRFYFLHIYFTASSRLAELRAAAVAPVFGLVKQIKFTQASVKIICFIYNYTAQHHPASRENKQRTVQKTTLGLINQSAAVDGECNIFGILCRHTHADATHPYLCFTSKTQEEIQ